MTENKSLVWYIVGFLGIFCIVLVSGCTSLGSTPLGLPSGLSVGSSTNVRGLDVTMVSAKIVNTSPFAATYKKETGKTLPPSKNIVAVIKISNSGSTRLEIGYPIEAYGVWELRDGERNKYRTSPLDDSKLKYELNPGEQTTYSFYADAGKNGTDTMLTKLKQHAELVLLHLEGSDVTGDVAKWDVTPIFNK